MMKLFNAFQCVIMYAALPFVIGWLDGAGFRGAGAAFYAAIGVYVISSGCMVAAVYHSFKDWD